MTNREKDVLLECVRTLRPLAQAMLDEGYSPRMVEIVEANEAAQAAADLLLEGWPASALPANLATDWPE